MRRGIGGDSSANYGHTYSHSHVEDENTNKEDLLADKVKTLKSLTIDIGEEVRYQNKMLTGMDDDFDRSQGFLSSTMGRLTAIARSGSNWHICYLLLFCVFVFVFLWLFLKFR